ncbi:unnamed protein product [Gulo gulo]|uniref:Uncharacterized protein n=1 Tax=Gulo gulo TaxID=48420 RepID=A0A9X9Q8V2_GULGU|nr:unnamed protein product [Gulo gulo]
MWKWRPRGEKSTESCPGVALCSWLHRVPGNPRKVPQAREEGKEGISEVAVLCYLSAPRRPRRRNSDQRGNQEVMSALETVSLSHPLRHPPHMLTRLCAQVCQLSCWQSCSAMQASGSLLRHRAHAGISHTPLLTHLSLSVLQIPRDERGAVARE